MCAAKARSANWQERQDDSRRLGAYLYGSQVKVAA